MMVVQNKIDDLKSKYLRLCNFVLLHEWLLALGLTLSVILIGFAMGLENDKIISVNHQLVHYTSEPGNKLSLLANWDGVHYISIALHGYNTISQAGFFPLYPLLISILHALISSPLVSALLISWVCLVGAIYFYLKIIKLYFKVSSNTEALKAAMLFLFFPSGVYLLAVYTESLFALLSLGAIYYALQRKYIKVALLAMLATATHINGVFLLLLVALILIEEKERIRNVFITLGVGSLGLISYMAYLLFHYHNPLEFIKAQKGHHWLQGSIISKLGSFGAIDYLMLLAILWTTIYWWKRRKSFAIYSGLYLLIPLIGGQFGGYPRYVLMIFPLQFMLYEYFRNKGFVYTAILMLFAIGWAYVLLQFAAGYIIS